VNRRIGQLSWPEVRDHMEAGRRTIVVALGATEQHGPHLPLATDTLLGDELARRVADRLDALVAPTVAIGCSSHHSAFPGTLSVRDSTFAAVVADLVDSFATSGFERAVLLPSHGGNFEPLGKAVAALPDDPGIVVDALTDRNALVALPVFGQQEENIPLGEGGLHSGEWETSLLLGHPPRADPHGALRAGLRRRPPGGVRGGLRLGGPLDQSQRRDRRPSPIGRRARRALLGVRHGDRARAPRRR
jgi:creatinine amidohydrolase